MITPVTFDSKPMDAYTLMGVYTTLEEERRKYSQGSIGYTRATREINVLRRVISAIVNTPEKEDN